MMLKFAKFFLLALALNGATVFAEDAKDPMQDPEMMKKFQEYSTPGEQHKMLASMAGTWKYTSSWWATEGGKPEVSKGTSTMKMIMNGRFLQHSLKGTSMGMPYEGMGLTGYDNIKKKFDTIWIDSMGTGLIHGEGSYDANTKTLTDKGEYSCPVSEDKEAEYRGEWKVVDKNNMIYSMYGKGMTGKGNEFKTMEMVFKRK